MKIHRSTISNKNKPNILSRLALSLIIALSLQLLSPLINNFTPVAEAAPYTASPWIDIQTPTDGSTLPTPPTTISGTSEANSRVAIWIDDVYQTTLMSDANGDYTYTVPTNSLVCGAGDHQIVAYNLDKQWAAVGDNASDVTGGMSFATFDLSDSDPNNWTASGSTPWSQTSGGLGDLVIVDDILYVPNREEVDYYDMSDPSSPVYLGAIVAASIGSNIQIQLVGDYLYVINIGSLEVSYIDITSPTSPVLAGTITTGFSSTTSTVIGNYLYLINANDAGVSYLDVSDPANPNLLGTVSVDTGNAPISTQVVGNYLYVPGADGVNYLDISDPGMPVLAGTIPAGTDSQTSVLTLAGDYLYAMESGNGISYAGEISYINVSDPSMPTLVGTIPTGVGSVPAFSQIVGDYLYVVEIGGLEVDYINISDPSSPVLDGTIPTGTGSRPAYIELMPDGRYLLVAVDDTDGDTATTYDDGVLIIDTQTNTIVKTINAGTYRGGSTDSGIVSAPHAISNITVTTGGCNVTPPPPPSSIDMTTPADGSTLTSQTQDISGTGATPNGEVEVFVDGISIGTTTADSNGNWTLVGSSLPCGEVEIEAVDRSSTLLNIGPYFIDASDPDPANWVGIPGADPVADHGGSFRYSNISEDGRYLFVGDNQNKELDVYQTSDFTVGPVASLDLSGYFDDIVEVDMYGDTLYVIGNDLVNTVNGRVVSIDISGGATNPVILNPDLSSDPALAGVQSSSIEFSSDGTVLFLSEGESPSYIYAIRSDDGTYLDSYDYGSGTDIIIAIDTSIDGNYLYGSYTEDIDGVTLRSIDISSFSAYAGSFPNSETDSLYIPQGAGATPLYGYGVDVARDNSVIYMANYFGMAIIDIDPANLGMFTGSTINESSPTGYVAFNIIELSNGLFAISDLNGPSLMLKIYDQDFNLINNIETGVMEAFSSDLGFTQNSDTHTVTVDCQSATASIGLAKNVVSIEPSADPDQFTYTLDFYLENFGDASLGNISILDDLVAQGYSLVSSPTITIQSSPTNPNSTITVNQNYDGDSNSNPDLLDPANSSLAASDSAVIRLVVDLDISNATGLTNQATVSAQDSSDPTNTTTDTSTNGTNPDPDGDDDPDSTPGTDDQPTSMDPDLSPILGLAKTIGAVVNNGDGTYTIPLSFVIQNTGSGVAEQLSLVDDLQTQFLNPDSLTISVAPEVVSGLSTITINPDYTGDSNDPNGADILDDTNSSLNPGDTAIVTMTVVVDPSDNNLTTLSNQAEVTATNPTDNSTVSDLSTSGSNPDQDLDNLDNDQTNDNNQDPTDNDEVTQINLPDDNQSLPEADLSLTKTLETTGEINVEDTITFALKLTNNSTTNSAPGSITITDILPTGLTYVNFTSANPNFNCSGVNTITCILDDDIPPTLSETVYINTFVSSNVGDSVSNIANLTTTSSIDPNNTNNIGLVSGIQITKPTPTPTNPTPTTPTNNQPNPSTPSKDINTNTLPSTGILSHPVTQLLLLISILSIPVLVVRRKQSEK